MNFERRSFIVGGLAAGALVPVRRAAALTGIARPPLTRPAASSHVSDARLTICLAGLEPSSKPMDNPFEGSDAAVTVMDLSAYAHQPAPSAQALLETNPEIVLLLVDGGRFEHLAPLLSAIREVRQQCGAGVFAVLTPSRLSNQRAMETELLAVCDGVVCPQLGNPTTSDDASPVSAARCLLGGLFHHGFIGYDYHDLKTCMHAGDVFSFSSARLPLGLAKPTEIESLQRAVATLLAKHRDRVAPKAAASVQLAVNGGEDLTLAEIDAYTSAVMDRVGPEANVLFYSNVRPEMAGFIEIGLLMAPTRSAPFYKGA